MTTPARRAAICTTLLTAAALGGCGKGDPRFDPAQDNTAAMNNLAAGKTAGPGLYASGPGAGSPTDPAAGGAPSFGDSAGNGFHTGDAAHSGGTGSGLMGFHGTGKYGTSAAISDTHDAGEPPKNPPVFVLPEQ